MVWVEPSRCLVADMDLIGLALMYKQGSSKTLQNNEATELLAQVYQITSLPLTSYDGRFFTPEVLVKGNIEPSLISILKENA